jgi:hypothetical protein
LSRHSGARAHGAAGAEYVAASRDLSQFALINVFVEGLAVFAVLAACGVLADGYTVLVHRAPRT